MKIYKVSHGNLSDAEYNNSISDQVAVMSNGDNYNQGKRFRNAPEGTIFYLCRGGNKISLIGMLTAKEEGYVKEKIYGKDNRYCRPYKVLQVANSNVWKRTAGAPGWTPSGQTTFTEIPSDMMAEFVSQILGPFFDLDLNKLTELASKNGNMSNMNSSDELPEKSAASAHSVNIIYYGPPGTGKTFKLTQLIRDKYEGRFKFVTFHQSYGYEDFVEGLRPVLIESDKGNADEADNNYSSEPQQIGYEIKPGVFKEICEESRKHPELRHAIFIDEINRGNVSKIFGELITLIEIDKRDYYKKGEKPFVEVTLPYSRENFSVPCNLDIIGTMNTADRSLAPLDIALRRRFEFVPLIPDTRLVKVLDEPYSAPLAKLFVGEIDIRLMLEKINERIEVLSNRDRCIGHAYFIPLRGIEDNEEKLEKLSLIFKDQIIPLLEEYFFDDWKKIGQVLGDHNKSDAKIRFITSEEINRSDLLGEDKDERNEDSSVRYRLNPDVFIEHVANEDVYIGIYERLA